MIAIEDAVDALPPFDKFASVTELQAFAESLRDDPDFTVEIVGTSVGGEPIHHVRFGRGSVKAMFVGLLHCSEPIGGLTCIGLLSLLKARHPAVVNADVEWHVMPCADPDGAILNEAWSQQPFTVERFVKGFHNQEYSEQIDGSFPIHHKNLHFDQPSKEASILKGALERVRPDFYAPLHNALIGGAFFLVAHDVGTKRYQAIYDLLKRSGMPVQQRIYHAAFSETLGVGVLKMPSMRDIYDLIEKSGLAPERLLQNGTVSSDYLAEIKPDAQSFVIELPYAVHPALLENGDTHESLRRLKLRLEADRKYVVTAALEEWDKVEGDLDRGSSFYHKFVKGVVCARGDLHEGLPTWGERTRDLLFNLAYSRAMTGAERFDQWVLHVYSLCHIYEFVRLLKASKHTDGVRSAIARLDAIFDDVLADFRAAVNADKIERVDVHTLTQIQLGSSFVVLNAGLESRTRAVDQGRPSQC